jgi:hypothetical protein
MLYKCANEACSVPFRKLREGKLFQVETEYFADSTTSPRRTRPLRRIEHYWLCDSCAGFVTLTFDRERGVITVPLPNGLGKKTVTLLPDPDDAPVPEQLSAAASNPVSRVQEVLK